VRFRDRGLRLRAISSSSEGRTHHSAESPQDEEGDQPKNQRSHHHERETPGGFYKFQEGFDLRARIARGRLLDFVQHFASYLWAFVKDDHDQCFENSRDAKEKKAAEGAEPGCHCRPNRGSGTAALRKGGGQKSRPQRSDKWV